MKTIEEIVKQNPVFLNDWSTLEDVIKSFAGYGKDCVISFKESLGNIKILFAAYDYSCYTGNAFVLFEKDGKLFEVNGSHCSCYGLEGQWCYDEEVNLEAMRNRLINGNFGHVEGTGNEFKDELMEFLGIIETKGNIIY